ncbi:MAG TPA: molybdopterin cofactor-binding domain-containing protein, partial [Burkholderiales bacterium]|nr:molybdopterin cofactor-binding domain-containing protein [Burkholderiales bacterium]
MADEPHIAQKERNISLDPLAVREETDVPAVLPIAPYPIEARAPAVREQTPAVGQRATRPDARLHGLGQTRYIDDLALPGMLYARTKRAGIASARIVSIDTHAAEALPGVIAVLTGREIPVNSFGPSYQDQPVLASERVYHAGDGVAAVAATSDEIAGKALDLIRVEYEPLPAVFDPLAAMDESAPRVHPPESNIYAQKTIRKGDVDAGFAAADRIFEASYRSQMVEHVSIEPHAAMAEWDANGRVTIWCTVGRITLARADLARTLKLPLNRIRLVATVVGGNFGGKNEITQEPVLALLSKKAGRPVKGVYSRCEEFVATTTR